MATSDAVANLILDRYLGTSAEFFGRYMSLHTADPGGNGANEVALTGYSRDNVGSAWGTAAARTLTNTAAIGPFSASAGADVTVTHIGFWSGSGGGTFICSVQLDTPITFGVGSPVNFAIGAVSVTA